MKWFPSYVSVKNPYEEKTKWQYPYQGDSWPNKDDWYWVFVGCKGKDPYHSTPPKKAWWDEKEQRFLGMTSDVIAWRKMKLENPVKNK